MTDELQKIYKLFQEEMEDPEMKEMLGADFEYDSVYDFLVGYKVAYEVMRDSWSKSLESNE